MTKLNLNTDLLENMANDEILSAIGDGLTVHDLDFRIIYQNQQMKDLFGDCIGQFCYAAYERGDSVCQDCAVVACFTDGQIHKSERSVFIAGNKHVIETTAAPIRDKGGVIVAAVEVARDISERKEAKERHIRFKNLYAALSLTNKAIMCVGSPEELFSEICRVAVEHGKFSLATIVTLNKETGFLVPVAHSGKAENYLNSLIICADPEREEGQGPTGIAFREGIPYICNDFSNDPATNRDLQRHKRKKTL